MHRHDAPTTSTWPSRRSAAIGLAVLASVLATVSPAAMGQCSIPSAAATQVQVAPATQDAIRACADAARSAFASGDFAQIKRVRDALLTPLRQPRVSPQFRFSLDEALGPVLRDAVAAPSEEAPLNALRIAGELAGVKAMEVVSAGLADQRPAVRFMAASSLQRAFQHMGSDTPPAVLPLNVLPVIRTLGERLASETDPMVAEGYVLAYDAGCRIATPNFDAVAIACVEGIATGVGDRVSKGVGPEFNTVLLRSADAMANVVTRAGGAGGMRLDEPTRLRIARFAGDALTHAACRVQKAGADLAADERENLAEIVGRAENVFLLIATQLGRNERNQNLRQTLAQGGRDNVFLAGVLDVTGKLSRAPFGQDAARFTHACK